MNIKEFTNKDSDKNIYHYTSVEGIMSIIKNESIRFTECRFLNDKNEYSSLKKIIEEKIKVQNSGLKEFVNMMPFTIDSNYEEGLFDCIVNSRNITFSKYKFYILSCSCESDSLPLWNYYSKNSKTWGYNFQISKKSILNKMEEICQKNKKIYFYFGKVLYDDQEKVEFLTNKLQELKQFYDNEIKNINEINLDSDQREVENNKIDSDIQSKLYELFQLCRLFFKDEYFKYENEYRFVLRLMDIDQSDDLKREFTSINGVIRPHIDLKFNNIDFIESITLSPLIDHDIASKGIEIYLNNKDDKNKIEINSSKISIRF